MARMNFRHGWVPDIPDHRDYMYAAPKKALPSKVDLRPTCPPVVYQGHLLSCTANAIGNAHRFSQMKQGVARHFLPSRLFIYYNERDMNGTVDHDLGARIRDGIKSIAKQGACPERFWPYKVTKFRWMPPASAYKEAMKHQLVRYLRLEQKLQHMKKCLACGYPFIFGFFMFESFYSKSVTKSGKVPLPKSGDKDGRGHAVLAVGYEDAHRHFIVMNSWSKMWGDKGYCYMPYDYLENSNLARDFWTIRLVEDEDAPIGYRKINLRMKRTIGTIN
jgi:C1A family cysteine protease